MPCPPAKERPLPAQTGTAPLFAFDNSYARLPACFYARLPPTPVAAPRVVRLNEKLALQLNLNPARLNTAEGTEILAGNRIAEGSEPIAMAYAGHQFGNFVPQLGDGRAILLGEVIGRDGVRRDIHLKGSERPFPATATGGPCWGRSSANISSARRWQRSASPQRTPLPR
jgi:serine/tyrosine/threonine adenylyltransferase